MGLFSSIWKGIKNVFKGVLKIFSPILKPLGKILNTGWGKALMLAMSVFTLGASLLAGGQTFMQTAGSFLDKFVAGGKTFLTEALGIEFKPEQVAGGAVTPGVQAGTGGAAAEIGAGQAINPGEILASSVPGGEAVGQAGSMAMGPPPTGDVMQQAVTAGGGGAGQGAMLPPGGGAAPTAAVTPTAPGMLPGGLDPAGTSAKAMTTMAAKGGFGGGGEKTGNWLSKAAGKAWEFATSELGQELIGGAAEGYYAGAREQAWLDEERRIDDMWRNPNDPGRIGIESSRQRQERYGAPRGMAGAPAIYANRISQGSIANYAPSIPFVGGGG